MSHNTSQPLKINNTQKLQAVIAHAGYCSRRKAEVLISEGRVTINGQVATIGTRIDPETTEIQIDGKPLKPAANLVYYLVNKPVGYVSTTDDELGRPTVLELLPKQSERLYPVGRLDLDSEGLLLLTNDGELTYHFTHPKFEIPKTYEVALDRRPTLDALNHLRHSVRLKEGYTQPAEVLTLGRLDDHYWLEITIHEGWNRQVRRMFERVGYEVVRLIRTKMGPFELDMLEEHPYLELNKEAIKELTKKWLD